MAPGTSFDCSVPLSPEALEICRDRLTNGVLAEDGGCLVDSHHHIWDLANTPKAQSRYLNGDLESWALEGLDRLWYRTRLSPDHPHKNIIPTKKETFDFFAGLNRSYGSVQVGMNPYLTSHLSADYSDSHLKTDASVYVQAGWLQPNNEFLGETTWVHSESVKSGGWMGRGIVGRVDMLEEDGGSVERQLWEHLGASPNFRGIRYMAAIPSNPSLGLNSFCPTPNVYSNPTFLRNMSIFSRLSCSPEIAKPVEEGGRGGLSLDVWCYGYQIPEVTELAKRFPEVKIVLDHFGSPENAANEPGVVDAWLESMRELAECPNVYAKISGLMPVLGTRSHLPPLGPLGPGPTALTLHRGILGRLTSETLRLFTPQRCMFGSNYPVDKANARMGELVGCYYLSMRDVGMTEGEMRRVMRGTAREVYRLDVPYAA